jgi:hypothetical protein
MRNAPDSSEWSTDRTCPINLHYDILHATTHSEVTLLVFANSPAPFNKGSKQPLHCCKKQSCR